MKYIIGLGNPGEKYKYNRHNVAWLIFDELGLSSWKFDKYMNAEFTGDQIKNEIVLFIKPQTFMNNSGEIIASLKKEKDFSPKDIVLIYDDIDLAFGEVRISRNRGDGGHNGIKSITEHLKTKDTIRIRIGVSKKLEDGRLIKPNVLSNFPQDEREIIEKEIAPKIEKILKSLMQNELGKVTSEFNKK